MNTQSELYTLLHHLKACPHEFLDIHAVKQKEIFVTTRALILDLYRSLSGNFEVQTAELPTLPDVWDMNENHILSIQIGCWLFSHAFFKQQSSPATIHQFLFVALPEVCSHVKHRQWIDDDDRAEEFIRLALRECNMRVDTETAAESADRFDSLSTVKRQRVLAESAEAVNRMKEIRRKMAEQKAREAANVYGKE